MLAYLPTDGSWCKQPLPHMTLVYGGTLEDRDYSVFNQLAKDAITVCRITPPFSLDVEGIETFGPEDERVDVLRLSTTPALIRARQLVEHWNMSEHREFKPHATIGPVGSARGVLPTKLHFDRIMVAFGNEDMTFRLSYDHEGDGPSRY